MSKKELADRRKALEEAFFKKENERLLANLRTKQSREEARNALVEVMPLDDEAVLDQLIEVGIRAETWLAISLVPLVEVAWADRNISDRQRKAILEAAAENGIEAGSPARALLDEWLTERPLPKLREAWKAYIEAARPIVGQLARQAVRQEIIGRCRKIAEVAGGPLDLPRGAEAEERVLRELELVL